jgi:hypothetical protein
LSLFTALIACSVGNAPERCSQLLKKQLESELVPFGRREPSIQKVIKPDEKSAGVRTQGCTDGGAH